MVVELLIGGKMERNVKFAEDASLQFLEVIIPRRLAERVQRESISLPTPAGTGCTKMDIFIERALEYYLEASESGETLQKNLHYDPLTFVDIQYLTPVSLDVILPVALVDRLKEKCSRVDLPRRSFKDIFIEKALWYYLERKSGSDE